MAVTKKLAGIPVSVPAGIFWYVLIFTVGAMAIFGGVVTASLLNLERGSFLEGGMIITLYIIAALCVGLALYITYEHFTLRRVAYVTIAGAIAGALASGEFIVRPIFEALGTPELVTVILITNIGIGALIMLIAVPYIANIDMKQGNSYTSIFLVILAGLAFFAPQILPALWQGSIVSNNVQTNFPVLVTFSALVLVAGVAGGILVGAMAHWARRGPAPRTNLTAKE